MALIVNIAAFGYTVSISLKKNPYKEDVFMDFKYYQDDAARAVIK